ncbi:MAG: TBC1 domain family protein [Amphiamblys sp. WSBS2006]|nr:MAG: TBC1 domain family protein [Amphiamblys sp. WSBS2006]
MLITPERFFEDGRKWVVEKENRLAVFQRQQKEKDIWASVSQTIRALTAAVEYKYRISMKSREGQRSGGLFWMVSVSSTAGEAEKDWNTLDKFVSMAEGLVEFKDALLFVGSKIVPLVSSNSSGEYAQSNCEWRTFHAVFSLPPSEKLHRCYFCSIQKTRTLPGWLYVSSNYFGFYSFVFGTETKLLVKTHQISSVCLSGERRYLFPGVLRIVLNTDEKITLVNFIRSREAYDVLIASCCVFREKALRTFLPNSPPGGEASRGDLPPEEAFETVLEKKREEELLSEVGLGREEAIVYSQKCILFHDKKKPASGDLFVTEHYVCFTGEDLSVLVIPLFGVLSVSKVRGRDSTGHYAVRLEIEKENVFFVVGDTKKECDYFLGKLCASVAVQSKHVAGVGQPEDRSTLGGIFGYPSNSHRTQLERWRVYLGEKGSRFCFFRDEKHRGMCAEGVPPELRSYIWEVSSGALHRRLRSDISLSALGGGARTVAEDEIETDLKRSLPEYSGFSNEEGISRLRRVLRAYSRWNTDIGYCQAMNIFVSIFLIYSSESVSFWLLETLCENILPGYYTTTMHGAQLDLRVLEVLLERHSARVSQHLRQKQVLLQTQTVSWMVGLFTAQFSLENSARFFDCLFCFGCTFLFQSIVQAVKDCEAGLLQCGTDTELSDVFRVHFGRLNSNESLFQRFIQNSLLVPIRRSTVDKLRRENCLGVVHGVETKRRREILYRAGRESVFSAPELSKMYKRHYKIQLQDRGCRGTLMEAASFLEWVLSFTKGANKKEGREFLPRLFGFWSEEEAISFERAVSNFSSLFSSTNEKFLSTLFSVYSDGEGPLGFDEILSCFKLVSVFVLERQPDTALFRFVFCGQATYSEIAVCSDSFLSGMKFVLHQCENIPTKFKSALFCFH